MLTALVALAAGLGAVCRYGVDQLVQRRTGGRFPYGTLVINISGSLLLGLLLGLSARRALPVPLLLVLGTGFAGSFTTLSTWAWETLTLALDGHRAAALYNVVGSFTLGLLAAAAGLGLARL